jgi:hypothetical protein
MFLYFIFLLRCSGDNSPSGGFSFINLAENLEPNSCFAVMHLARRLCGNAVWGDAALLTAASGLLLCGNATYAATQLGIYYTQRSIHGNSTPGCFAAAQSLWLMRLQPLSSACEVGLSVGEVRQPSYDSQSYARFNQVRVGEALRRIPRVLKWLPEITSWERPSKKRGEIETLAHLVCTHHLVSTLSVFVEIRCLRHLMENAL